MKAIKSCWQLSKDIFLAALGKLEQLPAHKSSNRLCADIFYQVGFGF